MKISRAPTIATIIALTCIGLAMAYNGFKMAPNTNGPKPVASKNSAQTVTVIKVQAGNYQATISGHGEAKAHWALTLKAQVEGKVLEISERFATGNLVNRETQLARIDNTEYIQAIAAANATLAQAKLTLQEEKELAEQAQREWQRSGIAQAPSSPLVFRSLQLDAAQANTDGALASLETAKRDEKSTRISAPFDAVILTRTIEPGSYVNVGDTLATLNSTDKIEISVQLSLSQWQNLRPDLSGSVILRDLTSTASWTGYIARAEKHLDESSRQRNVIVALDNPFEQTTPLLPGAFVAVEISGRTLSNVLKLPASAISQDGQVWYITNNNTLANAQANKVFERGDAVYILPIDGIEEPQVVARPLVSYLSGMLVTPVLEASAQ